MMMQVARTRAEQKQSGVLKDWLTPKKPQTMPPVLIITTSECEAKELRILHTKLSRALHPWKTLYICSGNAQALFALTAKVSIVSTVI